MFRAPSPAGIPPLKTLLDDIPATRPEVARYLGISLATLARYERQEGAPRAIMLALFWETRWGRSAADCEAANWATLQQSRVHGMERYTERLRGRIAALEAALDAQASQAANQPYYTAA